MQTNTRVREWHKSHQEEKRLIARNWNKRHPEQHNALLKSWRRRNPDKVRLQNKRAKRRIRQRNNKRLYTHGVYPKIRWDVTCPRCKHSFKTMAKRPQCKCGYGFPRDFMEKLIDNADTTPCVCCGREIPHPDNKKGVFRKYCECCFPQIMALKTTLQMMRFYEQNPNQSKKWYDNNIEIIVAVTCVFCDTIIAGHGGKRLCHECKMKWGQKVPRYIHDILTTYTSFKQMPPDILAWNRIKRYRDQGIKTL